jgi:hypothetical protein
VGELIVFRITCRCGKPLSLLTLPKDLERGRDFSLKCPCGVNMRIYLRQRQHNCLRQRAINEG